MHEAVLSRNAPSPHYIAKATRPALFRFIPKGLQTIAGGQERSDATPGYQNKSHLHPNVGATNPLYLAPLDQPSICRA